MTQATMLGCRRADAADRFCTRRASVLGRTTSTSRRPAVVFKVSGRTVLASPARTAATRHSATPFTPTGGRTASARDP